MGILNDNVSANKASNNSNTNAQYGNRMYMGLAPNPNDCSFTITINSLIEGRSTWYLTDVSGNIIYNDVIDLKKGTSQINFANKELAAGVYFVRFDSFNEMFKVIVVKQ